MCPCSIMALCRQIFKLQTLLSLNQRIANVTQQKIRHYAGGGAGEISFTFATPADVYYKNVEVKQVDCNTSRGAVGILAQHVPLLAVLEPSKIKVFESSGQTKEFFVGPGTLTVNSDSSVQILCEEAHPLERFDREAVAKTLQKASSDLSSATTEGAKAEAQIAIDCAMAIQKCI